MAIDLDSVKDRVKTLQVGGKGLVSVEDMVSAGLAMESGARPPCGFVATSNETATANKTQGVHRQEVTQTVAVVLCLAMERRDSLQDVSEAWRTALLASLPGWTPTGARTPFNYVGFSVLRMGGGLLWLEYSFAAKWQLSN